LLKSYTRRSHKIADKTGGQNGP